MPARTLMVQGTSSGAGKSLLTAALCRIYARRGVRVLPFKAQNMSNNAAVTPCGGEIGRAQALQARAAGVEPRPEMNPVLVKPLADTRSEVIVLGRRDAELTALPWTGRGAALWEAIRGSLAKLRAEAELVVIEGAGSPAEVNLPDAVNMGVAREADAPVLLVADIDRGGAFAALYGTWALLPEADRARIGGFVLNRFRGDAALLAPAPEILRERTGVPTLGVVPWLRLELPDEDAASLRDRGAGGALTIAAVRLPHLANFDDLDPLAAEPGVRVRWTDRPEALAGADAVVLPGTRNTTADLRWLWESGLAAAVRARAAAGVPVVGLCGGYQMLGASVADPLGLEGGGEVSGLGLLDARTVLAEAKTTRRARGRWSCRAGPLAALRGTEAAGYEIHHGRTELGPGAEPLLEVEGEPAGSAAGAVWGCYLHGVFADDALRAAWLGSLRAGAGAGGGWEARLDRELDRLADAVEAALDMAAVDRLAGLAGARR
ncbi:MAG TPA: cobyric acid synthase [Longimicrobiaceae bacterium]|nr:cobyric acid synthase [Longimicrobiaceae bacterium]